MARKLRSLLALPLIVAGCSLFGGYYGSRVEAMAAAAAADPYAPPPERDIDKFVRLYFLVGRNFADPINSDKAIYKGAIPGMLETLDPHSNFYDQQDYKVLLRGSARPLFGHRHAGRSAQR